MKYSKKVDELNKNPKNVGSFEDAQNVGTGLVGAPACGDVMKLQIQVNDDDVIEGARFKTFGCMAAIASSSLATEMLKGKTIDEALTIKNDAIAADLALPPIKRHCSTLAEEAIHAAVEDLRRKNGQSDSHSNS